LSPPTDVAVIGGGIVGTAAAAFLAEGGARVTLYEREALAAGASGRNSGVVQHPFDPALVPLYLETVELYRRLADEVPETGFRLSDRPAGLLFVSRHERVTRLLADRLRGAFPEIRPVAIAGEELRRLEPALHPEVTACRVDMGYPIVPAAPTYAFATLAERAGVAIRQGHGARLSLQGDRCVGVEVAGRLEPAGAVVVAAGPWTPEILDPSGAWRPISPRWGVVVETLLASPPRHVMEEAEMDEALGTADVVAEAGIVVAEASVAHVSSLGARTRSSGHGTSPAIDGTSPGPESGPAEVPEFSLVTAAGVSAVGSTFLADEPDPPAWTERILQRATAFVPAILDAPIREVRACGRPVALDGRPLVGAVPWLENVFVAAGHGPWGISTGAASAGQVADLVLGRGDRIATDFAVGRFGRPPD
jgi:glycine/D-amino acid oxidase-like deaminating enzyme